MEHVQKNKPCIGNFEINYDNIRGRKKGEYTYILNDDLCPNDLINYSKKVFENRKIKEDYILLVLDECQLIFNARDWNVKGRQEWLSFFTQHRHFGYNIILVAQFDRMIDRQVRSLIEYEYIHRKVANYGTMGFLVSALSFGKLFICVQMWYPLRTKIGSNFFRCRKSLYSLYDSYNMFSVGDGVGVMGSPTNSPLKDN